MKYTRYLLRKRWVQWLLCRLIVGYIWLVYYTSRWTIQGEEFLVAPPGNMIFAFWHGRLLLMPAFCPKNPRAHVVISVHTDGEIIARAISYFGLGLIRGSSRKGGMAALLEAKKILQQGDNVAITPDGPRGPRMRVKGNIVALAKMTGLPIIPVTFSSSCAIVSRSWDRFIIALPFGKARLVIGHPITVDPECDDAMLKQLRFELEAELNRITAEADKWVGRPPILPGEIKDTTRE